MKESENKTKANNRFIYIVCHLEQKRGYPKIRPKVNVNFLYTGLNEDHAYLSALIKSINIYWDYYKDKEKRIHFSDFISVWLYLLKDSGTRKKKPSQVYFDFKNKFATLMPFHIDYFELQSGTRTFKHPHRIIIEKQTVSNEQSFEENYTADLEVDFNDQFFCGLDLSDVNLRNVQFINVCLEDTNLRGADLSTADLSNATLSGSIYDRNTKWPEGFDPENAGAILDED